MSAFTEGAAEVVTSLVMAEQRADFLTQMIVVASISFSLIALLDAATDVRNCGKQAQQNLPSVGPRALPTAQRVQVPWFKATRRKGLYH